MALMDIVLNNVNVRRVRHICSILAHEKCYSETQIGDNILRH